MIVRLTGDVHVYSIFPTTVEEKQEATRKKSRNTKIGFPIQGEGQV